METQTPQVKFSVQEHAQSLSAYFYDHIVILDYVRKCYPQNVYYHDIICTFFYQETTLRYIKSWFYYLLVYNNWLNMKIKISIFVKTKNIILWRAFQ
jgi:hypothetical protein